MKELEINLSLTWEKFSKELNGASIIINEKDYAYANLYDDGVLFIETCNFRLFVRKEDFSLGQKEDEDCGYPFPMEYSVILRNKSFMLVITKIDIAEADELEDFSEKFC